MFLSFEVDTRPFVGWDIIHFNVQMFLPGTTWSWFQYPIKCILEYPTNTRRSDIGVYVTQSLWNLTRFSPAILPMYQSKRYVQTTNLREQNINIYRVIYNSNLKFINISHKRCFKVNTASSYILIFLSSNLVGIELSILSQQRHNLPTWPIRFHIYFIFNIVTITSLYFTSWLVLT